MMKENRRNLLKLSWFAGLGLASTRLSGGNEAKNDCDFLDFTVAPGPQRFNMCGYAAPKLDKVRVGFIGLGMRGPEHLTNAVKLEGVEIKALCDIRPQFANGAMKYLKGTNQKPDIYTGSAEEWKKVCERNDIDLIYIATPWDLHTPMAVYAMEHGKHVCIEVPAAVNLDECWQLVETSEKTKQHCMMMENCCYDFFELLTLNMARQGYFGDIVHGEGAYIHNLLGLNFDKNGYWEMWRLRENVRRNGNLYPTHGLGPICQIMNINRGEKLDFLESRSSKDFLMGKSRKGTCGKGHLFCSLCKRTISGQHEYYKYCYKRRKNDYDTT